MKKVKVVIDIDEKLYKNVIEHTKTGYVGSDVWIAVANGTPYEERPKGKWIYDNYWHRYKCSVCGRMVETAPYENPVENYPFCHCGADMSGD